MGEIISVMVQASLLGAAVFALKNIAIAKEGIQTNSKRESVKFASELVRFYLDEIIETDTISYNLEKKHGFKLPEYNAKLVEFSYAEFKEKVKDQKAVIKNFFQSENILGDDYDLWMLSRLRHRNLIEAFATPFISGVADEEVAFDTIALTFCYSVEKHWLNYCFARRFEEVEDNTYYNNTIKLYCLWKNRIQNKELQKARTTLDEEMAAINLDSIKPIGV